MKQVIHVDDDGSLAPFDYEQARLADAGASFCVARCADRDELIRAAAVADVIWLQRKPPIDAAVLAALPRCRLVMRWGVGYDQIDVGAATELGIAVANAPTYGTQNVAEHAMALLLSLTRQVPAWNVAMHEDSWREPGRAHRGLSGHTLGIVGLGRIGSHVARLALSFGCRVVAHDVRADLAVPAGVEMVTLADLFAEADYVTLHTDLNETSRHLVDASVLTAAKPGLLLVNTSRGPVVDESALLAAIEAGVVAGAGLDVFETEPLPADSPLRRHPSVFLTPHIASSSPEARAALRAEMCDTTVQFLTTGWADNILNPQVRAALRLVP